MKQRGMKILAMLLTPAMLVGLMPGMGMTAYAAANKTITWDSSNWDGLFSIDETGGSHTDENGITASGAAFRKNFSNKNLVNMLANGAANFSISNGKFSSIEIKYENKQLLKDLSTGWTDNGNSLKWTGESNEITLSGYGFVSVTSIVFTIETADAYSVTLSGGANATTSGGATSQTGLTGAMTTVTYTANSGYTFPAFSNSTTNGVTLTRVSDTVVTVSGKPTANVNITVPDAAAIPTYTVSFAANGGSGSMASVTVNAGSTYNLPACDFTAPTGKQFKAWSYDGKEYAVGTQFTINSDATFIAVWQDSAAPAADKYTVTYEANNGSGETKTYGPYDAGTTFTVEGCSFAAPEGKVFDCWKGSDGKTYKVGAPVVLNANLTLTAQWKDEEEQQGGSGESGHGGITGDIVFIGGGYGGAEESWEYVGGQQRAWKVSLAPMVNGSAALGIMTGESTTTEMYVYPTTTIYVFPNANPGFVLDKIVWSLIDGSASYDITEAKNFVMPAMDVVVYVTFKPLGS